MMKFFVFLLFFFNTLYAAPLTVVIDFSEFSDKETTLLTEKYLSSDTYKKINNIISPKTKNTHISPHKIVNIPRAFIKTLKPVNQLTTDQLHEGIKKLSRSVFFISFAGLASRLKGELQNANSGPIVKALIGLDGKLNTSAKTLLEYQCTKVARASTLLGKPLPMIIWVSRQSLFPIINVLKKNNYFGLKDILIAGIQHSAPPLDPYTGKPIDGIEKIGLAHGQFYNVINHPKVKKWLDNRNVKWVQFGNAETASSFSPRAFAQLPPYTTFTIFITDRLKGDGGGGAFLYYEIPNQKPKIIIVEDNTIAGVGNSWNLNTNDGIILRSSILKVRTDNLPVVFEQKTAIDPTTGNKIKIIRGRTGFADGPISHAMLVLRLKKDPLHGGYGHFKTAAQLTEDGWRLLASHDHEWSHIIKHLNCVSSFNEHFKKAATSTNKLMH